MEVFETALPGVLIFKPRIFGDDRGFFMETWRRTDYVEHGVPGEFVQDNLSRSRRGVLRGLHYQKPNPQGKLVYVLEGEVFDVALDIRIGSPTFGQHVAVTLSADNNRQLWVPAGFAHGFCVTSESALFAYKCTDIYNPAAENSVRWDDPALGIDWPVPAPIVSEKDRAGLPLGAISANRLPTYDAPAKQSAKRVGESV